MPDIDEAATELKDKYFEGQLDDEEVLYVFRKHPIVMRKGLVLCLFGPLIGILPSTFRPELGFGWFFGGLAAGTFLGIAIFFPYWLRWYFTVFVVTNQRFIQLIQKGFFNREVSDIGLNHIQTMNYSIAGLEQTLFGFGTITMQTYMGDIKIHDIHHPAKTHTRIQDILREQDIVPKKLAPNEQQEDEEINE